MSSGRPQEVPCAENNAPPPPYSTNKASNISIPVKTATADGLVTEETTDDRANVASDSSTSESIGDGSGTSRHAEVAEAASKLDLTNTLFTFGPRGNFVLGNERVAYLLSATAKITSCGMELPYTVALGEDNRYFVACKGATGSPTWATSCEPEPAAIKTTLGSTLKKRWFSRSKGKEKSQPEPKREHDAPSKSAQWSRWVENLPTNLQDLKETRVYFGAGARYYAYSTKGCIWHDIPQKMEALLEKRHEATATRPRLVALGKADSFVLIWPDGTLDYDLCELYPDAEKALSSHHTTPISFIALDPFYSKAYFLEYSSGMITYIFSALISPLVSEQINLVVKATLQMRAVKSGKTYHLKETKSGGICVVVISPETKHTWTAELCNKELKQGEETTSQKFGPGSG
ncbi:hypothetical protein K504DRAFT_530811 [Pleomassaria siparia CBS 279.74]|uniref:Uncharacterized protein n=1 Tax=Pleomassaria siparia CBS 279.74 TaxID=1314801 RepID=A0A6G1KMP2_9PLEO|nr:hypothetical protein K504DRAFT_530811 [Pleomassaria siparia CBS 279.74]